MTKINRPYNSYNSDNIVQNKADVKVALDFGPCCQTEENLIQEQPWYQIVKDGRGKSQTATQIREGKTVEIIEIISIDPVAKQCTATPIDWTEGIERQGNIVNSGAVQPSEDLSEGIWENTAHAHVHEQTWGQLRATANVLVDIYELEGKIIKMRLNIGEV